ncbi:MAG: hypothetical protein WC599_07415 [Bacteroidales bacterium]
MKEFIYKDKTYKTIGVCMEVHPENSGGKGFLEIIYKDSIVNFVPHMRD